MNDTSILQNEAECLKCGDIIYSAYRHDFKECKCGEIFVDGGTSYLRCGFNDRENFKSRCIVIDTELKDKMIESLTWAKENQRNEFGALCALFRAMRDSGYKVVKSEECEDNS